MGGFPLGKHGPGVAPDAQPDTRNRPEPRLRQQYRVQEIFRGFRGLDRQPRSVLQFTQDAVHCLDLRKALSAFSTR